MSSLRAAEVGLALAVVSLYGVAGFTSPLSTKTAASSGCLSPFASRTSTSQVLEGSQSTRHAPEFRGNRRGVILQEAGAGGADESLEEYKRQMEEFMAQAHEKRLQAMEAVKAEVQRGYEEQIEDLQAKLAALPAGSHSTDEMATHVRATEPALAGAQAGGPVGYVGSAKGQAHPAYSARAERPGWEARWGSEELKRMSTVSAADVRSMEALAVSSGGTPHPAYAARSKRPGWNARWGSEEAARVSGVSEGASGGQATAAQVMGDVHPAYAARSQRPGLGSRWGDDEVQRMDAPSVSGGTVPDAAGGHVHPAYTARFQRPGWDARWGSEEAARVGEGAGEIDSDTSSIAVPGDVHPAYAARIQRPGWEARWGSEEPARMAAASNLAGAEFEGDKETHIGSAPASADTHPAYSARLQRPNWEARWGSEEKLRVLGSAAGVIASEGAAAGFAMAGGLDTKADGHAATGASETRQAESSLEDKLLPNDVAELKSMVVSLRASFQDYLLRSLKATNELKQSKTEVDGDLGSLEAQLTEEQDLRTSLQETFLDYMTRSGDAGASGKSRISQLEGEVARLATEAAELQRFTQEYMVKASSDKQKAIDEATASARTQASERIAALQAQVLELQAGA